MKLTIMIVEDDRQLGTEICRYLTKWDYRPVLVDRFDKILDEFAAVDPVLVLLDINLPFYDGFYWASAIRRVANVPIIYISSRSDEKDKIMGIAQGGDDYLEKPFSLELLKAKIDAMLRRIYQYPIHRRIPIGEEVLFDTNTASIHYQDRTLELTKSEVKVMSVLLEHQASIVRREELMMTLWDTDEYVSDTALTVLISRLRRKLKAFCAQEIIRTQKGIGYYI